MTAARRACQPTVSKAMPKANALASTNLRGDDGVVYVRGGGAYRLAQAVGGGFLVERGEEGSCGADGEEMMLSPSGDGARCVVEGGAGGVGASDVDGRSWRRGA